MAPERRAVVFFYGLFMDMDLLRAKGLHPEDDTHAMVEDYALRIGQRATLVRKGGGRVHGVVASLAFDELERLYAEPSVQAYRPEAVLVRLASGDVIAALAFTLPVPPDGNERNPDYALKLRAVAHRIGLPADYVASID
jgi:hypothetical protein